MKTPLRKLRVSDEEYARWRAAAPGGNVSAWLRGLAADALAWPGEAAATSAIAEARATAASTAVDPVLIGGTVRSAAPVAAAAASGTPEVGPVGSGPVVALEPANRQHVADSPADTKRVSHSLDVPRVTIGDPTPDDFVRREAALLASLNPKE